MGSGGIPATCAVSDSTPESTFEELDGERSFVAQNTGNDIVGPLSRCHSGVLGSTSCLVTSSGEKSFLPDSNSLVFLE